MALINRPFTLDGEINAFQKRIVVAGAALFLLTVLYVPIDQAYWVGPSGVKSGFLGNWTWIASLESAYSSFEYAGNIPPTISFPILIIEWIILGVVCGFLFWIYRDKLIEMQNIEPSLSDKIVVELIYADPPDSADDHDNQLHESEIRSYKSLEELVANRPDISRAQCEALWDYFKGVKSPKGKSCSTLNPVTAWPFPRGED